MNNVRIVGISVCIVIIFAALEVQEHQEVKRWVLPPKESITPPAHDRPRAQRVLPYDVLKKRATLLAVEMEVVDLDGYISVCFRDGVPDVINGATVPDEFLTNKERRARMSSDFFEHPHHCFGFFLDLIEA